MVVVWALRLLGTCVVFLILGCAAGISQQARSQVTYNGSFAELQAGTNEHMGEIVMLGGKVIETKGYPTFSEIAVLQLPLGKRDLPLDGDRSDGRYLVRSEQFLDPAIYRQGSLLTVVGKLSGREVRSIGEFQYTYPLLEAIEIKRWPQAQRTFPGVHFGIGVGAQF